MTDATDPRCDEVLRLRDFLLGLSRVATPDLEQVLRGELEQLVGVGVPRRSKTLESLSLRHGAEA